LAKDLDALIDEVAANRPTKCMTCRAPRVAAIVARYFERLATGEVLPSFMAVHRQLIAKIAPIKYCTVRNHVVGCLGLDFKTGKKL
jgi:hypothetical protein